MTILTELDRRALRRCLQIRGWPTETTDTQLLEHGGSAAWGCQSRSLKLKPWQLPPVYRSPEDVPPPDDPGDVHGIRAAAELLRRMLALAFRDTTRIRLPRSQRWRLRDRPHEFRPWRFR